VKSQSRTITLLVLAIFIVVLLSAPIVPVKITVTKAEEVKEEKPVNYKVIECYIREILVKLVDWELEVVCIVENVDALGGTFTIVVYFYDKGVLAYQVSDKKYIGPGERVTFRIVSKGLAWSTDWKSRYRVKYDIIPPTKIVTHIVTRTITKTEYRSILRILVERLTGGP